MEIKSSEAAFKKLIFSSLFEFLRQIFTVFLATVFLIGGPLLLLFVLPLFLYRYILGHVIQRFNPNFGKLLTARATMFAQDDFYTHPKFTLMTGSVLEGNLDFNIMKESIRANLVDKKSVNGDYRFPELRQYIAPWGGFLFWKRDNEFNIDNHVQLITPKDRYEESELRELQQKLLERPWVKGQSVWKFFLVNNYFPKGQPDSDPKSVMFCLIHHSLVDGFAAVSLLSEGVFGMTSEFIESELKNFMDNLKLPKVPFWYYFLLPFLCAYDAACIIIRAFQPTPWRPLEKNQTGKFHLGVGDLVPLQHIKAIKSYFGVSFSSVTNAVVCGAIREMMVKKGTKLPKTMVAGVALPLPRRHTKLRNIMTGSQAYLPIRESDPIERLNLCSKDYKRLKRSTIPLQTHWAFSALGSLPTSLCRTFGRNRFVPIVMSNFVAGAKHYYACGHKMESGLFAVGPQPGSAGVSFWMGSYVDMFRISVVTEASVLTREETAELASEVVKQINNYLQYVNV